MSSALSRNVLKMSHLKSFLLQNRTFCSRFILHPNMLRTRYNFKLIVQMFKIWGESKHFLHRFNGFFLSFPRKQKVKNGNRGVWQFDVNSTGWLMQDW